MQYKIIGEPLSVVICDIDAGETLFTECGSMSWMSPNIKMETTSNGGIGKALGRMFAGERFFMNKYTAMNGPGQIAFAASFPCSIKVFDITPNEPIIVQKRGFLVGEKGVELSVYFQKKVFIGIIRW